MKALLISYRLRIESPVRSGQVKRPTRTLSSVTPQHEGYLLNVALLQGHMLANVRITREDV